MRNYWSIGKFSDWLRGKPKLDSGTCEEWRDWRRDAKAAHPFRYWLAEEGLDAVQDFVRWPIERINDVRYYLNNRFASRTHTLTSHSLEKGRWHEFEKRLLHCAFDELVNFVEIEKAWMTVCWNEEASEQFNTPWWRKNWWGRWFVQWRSPEAGLHHLAWEMELKNIEWVDPTDPIYGTPTPQATSAKEQLALYYWWKHVRPHRTDPHDYSGWNDYCEERRLAVEAAGGEDSDYIFSEDPPKDKERTRKMLDLCHQLEENYAKEDEEMLIRLIKVRQHLWT